MGESKELPVTLDIDFTVNLMDCLPLCIISAKDDLKNWVNQNFMLPVACMKPDGILDYIITDGVRYGANYRNPEAIVRHSFVCGNILRNVKDIVDLLIDRIEEDWYSILFVDRYYIRGTFAYQESHNLHEVLIYGYDKEQKLFHAITYARKMCLINISFEDLQNGFRGIYSILKYREEGWYEYTLMLYQCIKHTETYPFVRETFIRKFNSYRDGLFSEKEYFENLLYMRCGRQECFFGIKANEAVIMKMKSEKEMFMNAVTEQEKYSLFKFYSVIHTFSEFHAGFLKRLKVFIAFDNTYSVNENAIEKYEAIVRECEKIRLLYLKIEILLKKKDDDRIITTVDTAMRKLELVHKREKEALSLVIVNL